MNFEKMLTEFERPELEFKASLPERSDLAKTICAFANGRGGRLILGVEERDHSRKVVGLPEDELFDFEARIARIVRDRVEATVVPHFSILTYKGQSLLVVRVYPGNQAPYFLKAKGREEGTYIRVGSTNRRADLPTIQELERRRLNISYDMTPAYNLGPGVIEEELVREFLQQRERVRGQPPVEVTPEALLQLGALVREGEALFPSVGGVLLFSREPTVHFPQARVRCARFRGTEAGEFIDEKEFGGPLASQVEQAMRFFKMYVARGAKIEGLYREEKDAYPEAAVREGLLNAVCHRDYNLAGSEIKFAMFDNRIELTSPGPLPVGMSLETLGSGASEVRNRFIARVFRDLGLIEQWGWGIAKMREAMAGWGLAEPEFREVGRFFRVTLKMDTLTRTLITVRPAEPLGADEAKLMEYLEVHGKLTTKEAIAIIGKARSNVYRKLKALERANLIYWKGQSKNDPTGHYVRHNESDPHSSLKVQDTQGPQESRRAGQPEQ